MAIINDEELKRDIIKFISERTQLDEDIMEYKLKEEFPYVYEKVIEKMFEAEDDYLTEFCNNELTR